MLGQQARADKRFIGAARRWFIRNAPELQFWGYEGGNILAAIAGAGGFAAFAYSISFTLSEPQSTLAGKSVRLLTEFPDATATIGLAIIVLWSLGLGALARRAGAVRAQRWIDGTAVMAGLCLIAATLVFGAN